MFYQLQNKLQYASHTLINIITEIKRVVLLKLVLYEVGILIVKWIYMYECQTVAYNCSGNGLHCFLKHNKILFVELKNVYVFIYKSNDRGYISIVT